MRTTLLRISALLLVALMLVSAVALPKVQAQAEDEKIVCDSDLILSLYVASEYFNLGSVLEGLAASSATQDVTLDLANFELGQYEGRFADLDPEDTLVDADTVTAIVAELSIPETDRMTAAVDPANALQLAVVTGEPAECSILRLQLNVFYNLVADLT